MAAKVCSTTKGRFFFMEINPDLVSLGSRVLEVFVPDMAEIPALFFKTYKDELNDKAVFNDDAGNEIEVQLEKGERIAVIVKGLANIAYVYGLSLGGWLKVLYMGDDHFYTVKVMDQNMTSKEVECFPCRFYIDMIPPYASLNGKANISATPTSDQSTNLPTPSEVETVTLP
ncbi:hypothetical protein PIB30_074457 [Stylosanthes scabra]|uniref:Uncharacterized protein n=1 Tax=Stylosanthes scabra TaxID=79078 RepID=A0ABU6SPV8_9FABA|nr:hypothetical protein [Stylosanthes scabra]